MGLLVLMVHEDKLVLLAKMAKLDYQVVLASLAKTVFLVSPAKLVQLASLVLLADLVKVVDLVQPEPPVHQVHEERKDRQAVQDAELKVKNIIALMFES